jgi:hypothetical protein
MLAKLQFISEKRKNYFKIMLLTHGGKVEENPAFLDSVENSKTVT